MKTSLAAESIDPCLISPCSNASLWRLFDLLNGHSTKILGNQDVLRSAVRDVQEDDVAGLRPAHCGGKGFGPRRQVVRVRSPEQTKRLMHRHVMILMLP